MYNLIEYSSNYSKTTRNLWFYLKDETNSSKNDIALIILNLSSIRLNY